MSHNDGKKKLPIYVGHAKMTTSLVGSLHLRDEKNNFRHQYVWKKNVQLLYKESGTTYITYTLKTLSQISWNLPGKVNC